VRIFVTIVGHKCFAIIHTVKSTTLKRLFKAIDRTEGDDLVKIAKHIIEEEIALGHHKLASALTEILASNLTRADNLDKELKSIFPAVPTSKRGNLPLAKEISHEKLRHHMVLPKDVEARINRIEKEFVARERLAKHGLLPSQKILLYGSPGCGKTLSAERIAWNVGLPLLKVRFEAVLSSYLGESLQNLRMLFEVSEHTPCVLLLDEFDLIAKSRDHGQDVGEMHRLVNMILFLLEEYSGTGLLIATTNLEGSLDKAVFRRFDEVIKIPKPERAEILELLQMNLSSLNLDKNIAWPSVIDHMNGFSAAQVEKVALAAAKHSIISQQETISEKYLILAVQEING
jgi:SpoVK/Ycf46/Vps4 family AAA+-type ATPase